MTPHDITLRERADELEDENMWLDMRVSELKVINELLRQQLRKVELRLRIAISVAVGATAGLVTSLLF